MKDLEKLEAILELISRLQDASDRLQTILTVVLDRVLERPQVIDLGEMDALDRRSADVIVFPSGSSGRKLPASEPSIAPPPQAEPAPVRELSLRLFTEFTLCLPAAVEAGIFAAPESLNSIRRLFIDLLEDAAAEIEAGKDPSPAAEPLRSEEFSAALLVAARFLDKPEYDPPLLVRALRLLWTVDISGAALHVVESYAGDAEAQPGLYAAASLLRSESESTVKTARALLLGYVISAYAPDGLLHRELGKDGGIEIDDDDLHQDLLKIWAQAGLNSGTNEAFNALRAQWLDPEPSVYLADGRVIVERFDNYWDPSGPQFPDIYEFECLRVFATARLAEELLLAAGEEIPRPLLADGDFHSAQAQRETLLASREAAAVRRFTNLPLFPESEQQ